MNAHWQYLKYVLRHKWFVFVAGRYLGVPLWQLLIHDLSKFSREEWGPYVEYFYGPDLPEDRPWDDYWFASSIHGTARTRRQERFDHAWLHHQRVNPHHWQYWLLKEDSGELKPLEMPAHYIYEMIADWCGVGLALGKGWENTPDWYTANKDKMLLAPMTRTLVELLVERVRTKEERERRSAALWARIR